MPEQKLRVVIDTREQAPWVFGEAVSTISQALPAGDYSLPGHEWEVSIERKSADDLVNTLFHDWIRFRKELKKLAGFTYACIAVEAGVEDILAHRYVSETHPNSVLGRSAAIFCDYGVPVFFWGPRPAAIQAGFRFLNMASQRLS